MFELGLKLTYYSVWVALSVLTAGAQNLNVLLTVVNSVPSCSFLC